MENIKRIDEKTYTMDRILKELKGEEKNGEY